MSLFTAFITYFGQKTKVACDGNSKIACDGNCRKAWGINNRPKRQLSDDPDDYVFLADSELGDAPADPGTYEGGYGKPTSPAEFPNKWCVRECERSEMSAPGKWELPLVLPDMENPEPNMKREQP